MIKSILGVTALFITVITSVVIVTAYIHTSNAESKEYVHKNFVSKDNFGIMIDAIKENGKKIDRLTFRRCENGE